MRKTLWLGWILVACTGSHGAPLDADNAGSDAAVDATPGPRALGTVGNVVALPACPNGAPPGSGCKQITVSGCPGIETEAIVATIAVLAPSASTTLRGTITHFKGGGGQGFQVQGTAEYQQAGFRQVYVSWPVGSDWEQTATSGIKTAACRPATVLAWIFSEPSLHAGSRSLAFCGEGFSGGTAQLGYALAQYGMADYLDYVNELSGPPFERIDLGCDGSAPSTATVCSASVTTQLPASELDGWENTMSCGTATAPAADLARWNADSIGIGGLYAYPNTRVEFFDCTNSATAVTAMSQLFHDQIVAAEGGTTNTAYHCYAQADGCQNESLGTQGDSDAIAAMTAGCTARH